MLRIGLTGGIGSGKTTVAKIFEGLGIPVYYADLAARELLNNDVELKAQIVKHFGEQAYSGNTIDRKFIAAIVFNDPGKLTLLNSLTHPATIAGALEWMKRQQSPYVIKEAALIFESDSYKDLDLVIGVYSPEEVRIKRVMERDGLTREEIVKRIGRQMNEEEKMERCDFIIVNDDLQLVLPQVLKLHEELLKRTEQPVH